MRALRPILAEIPAELRPITPQNLKPEYLPAEVPSEFAEQQQEQAVRGQLTVPISTVPVRSYKAQPVEPSGYSRLPAVGPVPARTAERAARVHATRLTGESQASEQQLEKKQHERLTRSRAATLVDRSVSGIRKRRLNVLPA